MTDQYVIARLRQWADNLESGSYQDWTVVTAEESRPQRRLDTGTGECPNDELNHFVSGPEITLVVTIREPR